MGYELVTNYREDQNLRASFNALAKETFGINFDKWYELGLWTDVYKPYSLVLDGHIIANVSVNELKFSIGGQSYSALQIGTVMTKMANRGQGLGKRLMNYVLDLYKGYDIIYLFSNKDAIGFYEQFEFQVYEQSAYVLKKAYVPRSCVTTHLSIDNPVHRDMIVSYSDQRYPNELFEVRKASGITAFYATNVFPDNLYYIELIDAIIIASTEDGVLYLHDLIARTKVDMDEVIPLLINQPVKEVRFAYTPDFRDDKLVKVPYVDEDSTFFIKTKKDIILNERYPITAMA
ncbi:MAG: GNAT family N-acetyltransferase [Vallitaleaceae bacterium]|jgi:GNAT superfamily N-acetyltransferase|nr:GNAT family N-acetyltransferase [Vallitaleaceae bacterium]